MTRFLPPGSTRSVEALNFLMFAVRCGAIGAVLCASFTPAHAAVMQPNGQAIPLTGRLQNLLNGSSANNNINEMIDEQRDAQVQPEKFSPLCNFSGRYVAKGGNANFAIGWYNVDDTRASNNPPRYVPVNSTNMINVAAANSNVFILFPFATGLPPANMLDLNSASIRMHPRYTGGLIGFVLVPNGLRIGNRTAPRDDSAPSG